MSNAYIMIGVMALTTYLIRAVPLLTFRRRITNPFVRSFLHYVPYVTLSVMIFPDVLGATGTPLSALAGFVVMALLAWIRRNMFLVALGGCVVVYLTELIVKIL